MIDTVLITYILMSIITFILSIYLLNFYHKLRIVEFLLLSIFFFLTTNTFIFQILAYTYNLLIFYKFERIAFILAYLSLYLFLHQLQFEKRFPLLKCIFTIYALIMIIMISQWELLFHKDGIIFMGNLYQNMGNAPYRQTGAGIIIGNMEYSTQFPLLNIIYNILISLLGLTYAIKIKIGYQTPKMILAKNLWISIFLFHLIYYIIALIPTDYFILSQIPIFIASITIVYILMFNPEGVIISKHQTVAIYKLHHIAAQNIDTSNKHVVGIKRVYRYLNSLPERIISELNEDK